jgi:sec-independent protein translocase protein TatB
VFNLSPIRLLIIVIVALIVLGPDKLPQFARQAGAAWKTLKGLQERVETEIRTAVPDLPRSSDIARYARSPVSLLNQLADRVDAQDEAAAAAVNGSAGDAPSVAFHQEAEPPEVLDPDRPPVAWGDPSLN